MPDQWWAIKQRPQPIANQTPTAAASRQLSHGFSSLTRALTSSGIYALSWQRSAAVAQPALCRIGGYVVVIWNWWSAKPQAYSFQTLRIHLMQRQRTKKGLSSWRTGNSALFLHENHIYFSTVLQVSWVRPRSHEFPCHPPTCHFSVSWLVYLLKLLTCVLLECERWMLWLIIDISEIQIPKMMAYRYGYRPQYGKVFIQGQRNNYHFFSSVAPDVS